MTDNRKLISDLTTNIMTAFPDTDEVKLTVRIEEVVGNFDVKIKTNDDLDNDLVGNIKLYISAKRLEGLSELTLEDYYRELMLFDFKVNKPTVRITTADIRHYLAGMDDVMASTQGKKLSVIKSFFIWLVDEEIILRNPAARIKQMKQPKRLPKALTAIELEILREACETLREQALVEVMYSTGCRLSEVSGIKRSDVDWSSGSIRVIGKGDKERVVYLNPKASYHLERYLEECEENENESEYLFSTERHPYRQMQNKTIQDAINKIAARTNIRKNITPHVFRHTFATLAMENGIELGDLQQLLGHSNPGTTLRYAAVSEERKHNAHKRFVR